MRPQTVTLVFLAIMLGLVCAWAAKVYLEPKVVAMPAPPQKAMVFVLTAQTNISAHTKIRDQDVLSYEVPEGKFPADALRYKGQAVGRTTKKVILGSRPILEEDLFPVGSAPTLADQLKPGERCVSLRVDDPVAFSGAIEEGSIIDVSLTYDAPDGSDRQTVRLLHALRVLNVPAYDPTAQISVSRPKTYLTVAANSEQAKRLILAQEVGTTTVTLCSSTDESSADADNPMTVAELLGLKPSAPPAAARSIVSEIYRGNQRNLTVFNENGELPDIDPAFTGAGDSRDSTADPAHIAGKKGRCLECERKARLRALENKRNGGDGPQPTPALRPSAQNGVSGNSVGNGRT